MAEPRAPIAPWILGAVALVLLAVLVVAALYVATDEDGTDGASPTPVTVTHTATPVPPPPTATQTDFPPPEPETSSGSTPTLGGACLESEVRTFGTAADGQSLVCTYMGANGGYEWVQHAENDGSVHNIGEPCDPAVDRVAQDHQGKAIMCGGQVWVGSP